MELDVTLHHGLLLFTLQDKSCSGAMCSSCVAQWEVRPEAGCRWGACSHTQLPPLGCLAIFQPLFFLMLKMHLSSCGLEKVKHEWQPTVDSRSTDTNTHCCAQRRPAGTLVGLAVTEHLGQRKVINKFDVTALLDKLHKDITCRTRLILAGGCCSNQEQVWNKLGHICMHFALLLHLMTPKLSKA